MLTHFLQEVRYSIVGQHGYAPHFFGLKITLGHIVIALYSCVKISTRDT